MNKVLFFIVLILPSFTFCMNQKKPTKKDKLTSTTKNQKTEDNHTKEIKNSIPIDYNHPGYGTFNQQKRTSFQNFKKNKTS